MSEQNQDALIKAAAPEMLAALRGIEPFASKMRDRIAGENHVEYDRWAAVYFAIAKAEGRS